MNHFNFVILWTVGTTVLKLSGGNIPWWVVVLPLALYATAMIIMIVVVIFWHDRIDMEKLKDLQNAAPRHKRRK